MCRDFHLHTSRQNPCDESTYFGNRRCWLGPLIFYQFLGIICGGGGGGGGDVIVVIVRCCRGGGRGRRCIVVIRGRRDRRSRKRCLYISIRIGCVASAIGFHSTKLFVRNEISKRGFQDTFKRVVLVTFGGCPPNRPDHHAPLVPPGHQPSAPVSSTFAPHCISDDIIRLIGYLWRHVVLTNEDACPINIRVTSNQTPVRQSNDLRRGETTCLPMFQGSSITLLSHLFFLWKLLHQVSRLKTSEPVESPSPTSIESTAAARLDCDSCSLFSLGATSRSHRESTSRKQPSLRLLPPSFQI